MPEPYPAVVKVKASDDFILILTFSNGETRLFDMKPYLDKGIFRELRNLALFQTVHISFDTIEWDNNADFDPEVLFKLGKKIKEKKTNTTTKQLSSISEPTIKYRKK